MRLFSDTMRDGSSGMGTGYQQRGKGYNARRKYALEVSVQAKFHAVHLRKTFRGTPVLIVQVPFKLILKPDRANNDVQLMIKFQVSARNEAKCGTGGWACITRDHELGHSP